MSQSPITVTQLVHYLKNRLENDRNLQSVLVEGEISNFKPYNSGHWYFSIKDSNASIRCVMFSFQNKKINFRPKDGDKLILRGDISVYEGRGEMNLIVTNMTPSGIGDLYLQYEALKKKLEDLGLFDSSHKKPIPKYAMRIALVTGKETAARADVYKTIRRRWPVAKITDYPVLVQGKESAAQIMGALLEADEENYDVILLCRGGGSLEDLWSFNDESLANIIYQLKTPIITGIGHEVDFTIADFVADLRAPTPTGAAECATPDILEVRQNIKHYESRINYLMNQDLKAAGESLDLIRNRPVFRRPETLYREYSMQLVSVQERLDNLVNEHIHEQRTALVENRHRLISGLNEMIHDEENILNTYSLQLQHSLETKKTSDQQKLEQYKNNVVSNTKLQLQNKSYSLKEKSAKLDALSPLKVLARGYSIVTKDNVSTKSIQNINEADIIEVHMFDGKLVTRVESKSEEDNLWQKNK